MPRRILYSLFLLYLCAACQGEHPDIHEEIVVEGWIESGGNPIVLLTKSFVIAMDEETDPDQEESIVLPWGKVTVSDGFETVTLTGDYDNRYMPPYVYSTSRMRGVPGRTYTLQVEYGSRIATAQTTIPTPDPLDSLVVSSCEESDTLYQITAYYSDNPETKDYYSFHTRIFNRETRFYPSFLGVVDDERLALHNQQIIQPGLHQLTNEGQVYRSYFRESDSVQIKFAKIDATTYSIHKAYNEMTSLTNNPIFSSDISMPTNIQGGLGYWCGYGVTKYNVVIADSIK